MCMDKINLNCAGVENLSVTCKPLAAFSSSLLIITPLLGYSPWWQEETNIRVIPLIYPFLNLLTIVGNIKCNRPCTRFQLWAPVLVLLFHNCMTLGKSLKFSRLQLRYLWNWNKQSLPYWTHSWGYFTWKNIPESTPLIADMAVIFIVTRSTKIPKGFSHLFSHA